MAIIISFIIKVAIVFTAASMCLTIAVGLNIFISKIINNKEGKIDGKE